MDFQSHFPGITWTSSPSGTITSASANVASELGVPIIGKAWSEIFGPFAPEGFPDRIQNIGGTIWRIWAWPSENGHGPELKGAGIRIA
jgi:hypothetical protein